MKKTFIILITFLLLGVSHEDCFAQDKQDSLKVLFVGNSYTYFNNLPQIVSVISDSSKTKIVTKKSTAGGARLSQHWLGERGLKTKKIIENGDFDIVVLQGFSMSSINEPDSLRKYVKSFSDFIRKNNAKPYLYLTWAREKVPQYQKIINEVYLDAATESNAVLVNVGKAWELAKKLRPGINLFQPDGSHPTQLGTFLTSCVFVATILNEIPNNSIQTYYFTDKDGESIELMRLSSLDVIFCKKIAEEIALK